MEFDRQETLRQQLRTLDEQQKTFKTKRLRGQANEALIDGCIGLILIAIGGSLSFFSYADWLPEGLMSSVLATTESRINFAVLAGGGLIIVFSNGLGFLTIQAMTE